MKHSRTATTGTVGLLLALTLATGPVAYGGATTVYEYDKFRVWRTYVYDATAGVTLAAADTRAPVDPHRRLPDPARRTV